MKRMLFAAALVCLSSGAGAVFAAASPPSPTFTALSAIENRAEAIAEAKHQGVAARDDAAAIGTGWRALRPAFAANPAARPALLPIDAAIRSLASVGPDDLVLRRAANETTGALVPLFPLTGDGVPLALRRLDYLGRSVVLDASAREWKRADADRDALLRIWWSIRPQVTDRSGGPRTAAAYDGVTHAMSLAIELRDTNQTLAAAQRCTGVVDDLVKIFGG